MGIFAPIAMATTDAISTAYASLEGASDNGDGAENALAKIIIVKTGNLGPQDRSDFDAEVSGNHPSSTPVDLGGDESTRTVSIRPGSYNVHEIGESDGRLDRDFGGYDVSYSDDCSGTIKPRTTVTCTITNDFTGPS